MGTKIDQTNGLSDRIQALATEGITSRAKVAEIIRKEFPDVSISEPTIGRYIKKLKTQAHSQAHKILSDHVGKVLPEDLDALEGMEKICLEWANEAGKDQAERVAKAVDQIYGEVDIWIERFKSLIKDLESASKDAAKKETEPPAPQPVPIIQFVNFVVKRVAGYLAMDNRRQEERLKAMRMATSIIEVKLSKAGLLEDTKGNIIFTRQGDSPQFPGSAPGEKSEKPPGQARVFTVHDGGSNG